jgi:hypothetical protein
VSEWFQSTYNQELIIALIAELCFALFGELRILSEIAQGVMVSKNTCKIQVIFFTLWNQEAKYDGRSKDGCEFMERMGCAETCYRWGGRRLHDSAPGAGC